MIRINVRAGLRDTRRIQSAAREKLMTVSEFVHFVLRRILGRSDVAAVKATGIRNVAGENVPSETHGS